MARPKSVEELFDRQEIYDLLVNYARGADRGDVALIEAAYHDDAIEDHGGTYLGPASEYVDMLRKVLPKAPRMSHIVTNVNIELDGDKAYTECYFLTFSRRDQIDDPFDSFTMARVIDRLERRDGGPWKIAHRRLAWDWNHEMPLNESWGRGEIAPDPSKLTRGAKKPNDILYGSWLRGK